jgi:hypothetical protein
MFMVVPFEVQAGSGEEVGNIGEDGGGGIGDGLAGRVTVS